LDHRFSFSIPNNKEDSFNQPLRDFPVILSIFLTNPTYINKLVSIKLVEDNNDESQPIPLKKVREDLYVTKPITFPDTKFKIVVTGLDNENLTVVWVSPPTFRAIDTSNY
jgi:hypothetical protein